MANICGNINEIRDGQNSDLKKSLDYQNVFYIKVILILHNRALSSDNEKVFILAWKPVKYSWM